MKRPPRLWVAARAEVQKYKHSVDESSTSHPSPQLALTQP